MATSLAVPRPTGSSRLSIKYLTLGQGPHAAALKGEVAKLCAALPAGTEAEVVDAPDQHGRTALHYAVIGGVDTCIGALLDRGADVCALDKHGSSPLHYAARSGDSEAMKLLIGHATKENAEKMKSVPPACMALLGGHTGLLDDMAPINPDPTEGISKSLFHYTAAGGSISAAERLKTLKYAMDAADSFGQTPLHIACSAGHGAVAAFLIENGADVSAVDKDGWTAMHHAAAGNLAGIVTRIAGAQQCGKKLLAAADNGGHTAAHTAAAFGSTCALRALLESGASASSKDAKGAIPLHSAAFRGHTACVAMLSSASEHTPDNSGAIPLHLAALGGHANVCALLIRKGEDANAKTKSGTAPLHLAAHCGDVRTMSVLLENGAKLDAADANGITALHCAATAGRRKAIRLLVKAHCAINAQDNAGNTAVAMAVSKGHLACVRVLLNTGANAELQNKSGESSLHIAGRIGATEAVNLIMNHLWNIQTQYFLSGDTGRPRPPVPCPNAKDGKGRTALHLAIASKHAETARALTRQGCDPLVKDGDGKTAADTAIASSMFTQQEVDQLNKQRVAATRARDKDSPEYQARYKEALTKALQLFKNKPMAGIEHMQAAGLLGRDPDDIAEFLHETTELDKTKLGELIGGHTDLHKAILAEFVARMEFLGVEFEVALRRFLQAFRLPGEAQVIDRIMEAFAKRFYEQNPGSVFNNSDAVYVLAYSTIMLNTDAHSTKVKVKMTKAQWIKQNRKINNGEDFPVAFLENLYERIVNDEIKMEQGMFNNAEKKGWLTKQGGRIKTWKRRWFILSETCLYYFKTPQDTEPCGIITLENVEVMRNKSRKNSLIVRTFTPDDQVATAGSVSPAQSPQSLSSSASSTVSSQASLKLKGAKMDGGVMMQGHHETYVFCAESKVEMEMWLTAMNACIHHNPFYALMEQKTGGAGTAAPGTDATQLSQPHRQAIRLRLEKPPTTP